jgi:hypothetical protein
MKKFNDVKIKSCKECPFSDMEDDDLDGRCLINLCTIKRYGGADISVFCPLTDAEEEPKRTVNRCEILDGVVYRDTSLGFYRYKEMDGVGFRNPFLDGDSTRIEDNVVYIPRFLALKAMKKAMKVAFYEGRNTDASFKEWLEGAETEFCSCKNVHLDKSIGWFVCDKCGEIV